MRPFVRAVRDALAEQHFAARPTYGIGYEPVADPADLGDAAIPPEATPEGSRATWDAVREAESGASLVWAAALGAIVCAAAVDIYFLHRRHQRVKEEAGRG